MSTKEALGITDAKFYGEIRVPGERATCQWFCAHGIPASSLEHGPTCQSSPAVPSKLSTPRANG